MNIIPSVQERIVELTPHVSADLIATTHENDQPLFAAGYLSALKWVLSLTEKPPKAVVEKPVTLTVDQLKAVQIALDNDKASWAPLHGKTQNSMIKKAFIVMVGPYPSLTEFGQKAAASHRLERSGKAMVIPENAAEEAAAEAPKPKREKPSIALTDDQLACLQAAMDHDKETWVKLNGRTISSVGVRHKLTEMFDAYPALTEQGQSVAAEYGLVKSERFVELPAELQATAIVKKHHWTPHQVEAFKAAATGDLERWFALAQKTREAMVSFGYVTTAANPAVTPQGRTMAIMNGIDLSTLKTVPVIEDEPVGKVVGAVA